MSENKAPNPYASGGHKQTLEEQTRGKKYRVLNGPPEPPKVWGKDLSFADAHKLKEKVAGGRKSKIVLIEPMEVPHGASPTIPVLGAPVDPILRAQHAAGMSAARGAAAEAQLRADAAARDRKALEDAQAALEQAQAANGHDDEEPALDDAALSDLLENEGQLPTDDEIAEAGEPS